MCVIWLQALVDEVDKLGRNVLHLAAERGNLESIKYLVTNCYININSETPQGLTPLHFASKVIILNFCFVCKSGHVLLVEAFPKII